MTSSSGVHESHGNGQSGEHAPGKGGPGVEAALGAITREFQNLVADLEDLVTATGTLNAEQLALAKAKLQARVRAARDYVGEVGSDLSDQVRSGAKSADDYVRAQPWRVIGIAAGAALLIGFLLGRRR